MDYGKAVAVCRTARGLSQKDLALLISKTPSYISRIEKNERTPSPEFIRLLCEHLDVPVPLFMLLGKKYKDMDAADKRLLDSLGVELLKIITKD